MNNAFVTKALKLTRLAGREDMRPLDFGYLAG